MGSHHNTATITPTSHIKINSSTSRNVLHLLYIR